MTAPRTRKETKSYHRHQRNQSATKGNVCDFCEIQPGHPQFIVQTKNFKVIRNRFPYSLWDDHGVADHLMLVPKEHLLTLSEFSPEVAEELLQLISVYEKQGYNIYFRAPQSKGRSVLHQHTHLIKSHSRTKQIMLFIRKPYLRLVR